MSKSICTNYEGISAFSGFAAECKHHLIFGTGLRELAEEDGAWIPLLNREHNMSPMGTIFQIHENPAAEKLSKMYGQACIEREMCAKGYTKEEARTRFIARYGRSFE